MNGAAIFVWHGNEFGYSEERWIAEPVSQADAFCLAIAVLHRDAFASRVQVVANGEVIDARASLRRKRDGTHDALGEAPVAVTVRPC